MAVRHQALDEPDDPPVATTAEEYLAAVADLVEQIDPSIQILGLGPALAPERLGGPAWLLTGEDFHLRLEQTLTERDRRQGCRREA